MKINSTKCVRKLPVFLKLEIGYSVEKHLHTLSKLKLSTDIDIYYSEKRSV